MSLDLRTRFQDRLLRLGNNLSAIRSVLAKTAGSGPDKLDLPGLAWLLESSYSDIEEVLKGVAKKFDDSLPDSPNWHRDLLVQVAQPNAKRRAAIPAPLRDALGPFLAFRHFSRFSTYSILEWQEMQPLVDALPGIVEDFRAALESFLVDMDC